MDRSIRRLFVFFVLIFVGLVLQLTYVQVWAAPRLNTDAYNTRGLERQMRVERGLILAADGMRLAVNSKEGAYYLREYPEAGLTSPWLGYSSLVYGRAGVERAYNPELSGELGSAEPCAISWTWSRVRPQRGADLRLTLDPKVQRVAVEALGDNVGAVMALDPRTGAVLGLGELAPVRPQHDRRRVEALNEDPDKPLVDRAIQGRYPPGSVFKVIVAAARPGTGVVTPETVFDDPPGGWLVDGYTVNNFGGKSYGVHTFAEAFAVQRQHHLLQSGGASWGRRS